MTIPRAVAGGVMHALVAGVFGVAGTVVGAVYGLLSAAFADQDDDGFARGTLLGSVAGALVSLDLAHSLMAIWCCCSQDYTDTTGRIKRTVSAISGLASLADPRSGRGQSVAVFDDESDCSDFFSPPAAVVVVAKETAAADGACCPICLQVFEAGAGSAGRLAGCSHVYHVECITRWLRCKSHCPMCRHAVC